MALGRHVFVLNCNEGMNPHRTGKVLLGAVQTGAWTLYDNVNCLQADVMSVFAAQIGPILQVICMQASCNLYKHALTGLQILFCRLHLQRSAVIHAAHRHHLFACKVVDVPVAPVNLIEAASLVDAADF